MWWLQRRRREREADAAARLSAARSRCAQSPHVTLVHVAEVYQRARRGTKAFVVHDCGGEWQDAWFEGRRPEPGSSHVVLRGAQWGPHNRNPAVLYIDGIYESLPVGTLATAEKHWRRTADRAGAT